MCKDKITDPMWTLTTSMKNMEESKEALSVQDFVLLSPCFLEGPRNCKTTLSSMMIERH